MAFTFEQATGRILDTDGNVVAVGYAGGNCGNNPAGKNNPAAQAMPGIGPLPQGLYTIGAPTNDHPRLGPFAMPLTPAPTNQMFGRSAFFMHGDTTPGGNASEGCVIMPRAIRNLIWASGDHSLQVVSGE